LKTVSEKRLHLATDMDVSGVFVITHEPTGKVWIKYSKCMQSHAMKQFALLREKKHPDKLLQKAYDTEADLSVTFHNGVAKGYDRQLLSVIPSHLRLDQ